MPFPKPSASCVQLTPEAFRHAVWERDHGRDRFSGRILEKGHADPERSGEVCHLRGRNVMPEWARDPKRAILLSHANHIRSDGRGGYRLKIEGDDASQPLTFRLYDKAGTLLTETTS